MRFYGFGNYYLSSLQQGLQSAHTIADMFVKYEPEKIDALSTKPKDVALVEASDLLYLWAESHKTMVLLNGGNSADLKSLYEFLDCDENPYPFVKFHEDEQSLCCALTYVGIVLPAKIYENAAMLRNKQAEVVRMPDALVSISMKFPRPLDVYWNEVSPWEIELCERLNWYGLAK
jgi:hypothetical protein